MLLILMALLPLGSGAGQKEAKSASPAKNPLRPDRVAWYREAKFGMFIHWGPYSLASVEASWPIMVPAKEGPGVISEAEYRALPQRFNPVQFDPQAWVRLAKAAGQRYMIITSKHHDGFCMFDSAYTDYKVTKTPYGKDLLAQLARACREEDMPLGFYYSPPDMNHPGFRDTGKLAQFNWRGEPERPEWPQYLDYMELQLTELLTRYGPVRVIWFDGVNNEEKYNGRRFLRLIHDLQPATLINNRIGMPADYDTPEQFVPDRIPVATPSVQGFGTEHPPVAGPATALPRPGEFRPWETCMTINNTWAYNKNDRNFKSATQLIRTLVEVASKGGNLLLNVGPTPEGTIQPEFQERLLAIGEWLKANGESIYGTTYGPWQNLAFGRTTAKGNTIYLHVFEWPKGKLVVNGAKASILGVRLLATGKSLPFTQKGDRLAITVPAAAPDAHASVLALKTR
jgi:alpha-L-fucosidase